MQSFIVILYRTYSVLSFMGTRCSCFTKFVTFLHIKQLLKSNDLLMESGDAVLTRSVVGPVETDFFSFLFFLFFISTPGLNRVSDLILCNCCAAPS